MTDAQPERDKRDRGPAAPTPGEAAEAKRLAARRRFLLGGAAAAPVLLTVNRAQAVSWFQCWSNKGMAPPGQGPGDHVTMVPPGQCKMN